MAHFDIMSRFFLNLSQHLSLVSYALDHLANNWQARGRNDIELSCGYHRRAGAAQSTWNISPLT
jgi:hypothetical protein